MGRVWLSHQSLKARERWGLACFCAASIAVVSCCAELTPSRAQACLIPKPPVALAHALSCPYESLQAVTNTADSLGRWKGRENRKADFSQHLSQIPGFYSLLYLIFSDIFNQLKAYYPQFHGGGKGLRERLWIDCFSSPTDLKAVHKGPWIWTEVMFQLGKHLVRSPPRHELGCLCSQHPEVEVKAGGSEVQSCY